MPCRRTQRTSTASGTTPASAAGRFVWNAFAEKLQVFSSAARSALLLLGVKDRITRPARRPCCISGVVR
jgi:hypothetical protein